MASIDKRPDGKWRARWREFPTGPQRTKSFPGKVDAERHLVDVQHRLMVGSYVDPVKGRTTVEEYYRLWSARQPWRDSSRASVESLFAHHVLPALGRRPLGTVRRGDVESWAAGLTLSGRTAGLAVQYLGTMFEAAAADGLVAVNPARGAKRPRMDSTPVVPAAVADYMGHSPAVLLKTYAHIIPADNDRARSAVQAAFADLQTQSSDGLLRTDKGTISVTVEACADDRSASQALGSTGVTSEEARTDGPHREAQRTLAGQLPRSGPAGAHQAFNRGVDAQRWVDSNEARSPTGRSND